jgi:PKD repeat protein
MQPGDGAEAAAAANATPAVNRTYGDTRTDAIYATAATEDGYVLGGQTASEAWLLDVGPEGRERTTRTLEGRALFAVIPAGEGYVVAGETRGGDAFLARVAADGTVRWRRSFGSSGRDRLVSGLRTADGTYLFGGYYRDVQTWTVEVAPDGTVLHDRVYDLPLRLQDVTVAPDGDVVGVGGNGRTAGVVRLDGETVEWIESYGAESDGTDVGIHVATVDGGFRFVGTKNLSYNTTDFGVASGHPWTVRIDGEGTVRSQREYTDWGPTLVHDARTVEDGVLVVGETRTDGDVDGRAAVVGDGPATWDRRYGGRRVDRFYAATVAGTDEYVLTGLLGGGGNGDGWFVRTGTSATRGDAEAPFESPVAGGEGVPTDPDEDGLYEDVDGNGEANFADPVALAFVDASGLSDEQRAALDFDGDEDVDFDDAVALAFAV